MPSFAVQNSKIRNVTWKDGFLTVEFKSGPRYRYANVNISHYYSMCAPGKAMGHYRENIRGKYNSEKLKIGQA